MHDDSATVAGGGTPRRMRPGRYGAALLTAAVVAAGMVTATGVAAAASDATLTLVSSSSLSPTASSPITFTATVATVVPDEGAPTGTVTFSDAAGTLCSEQPLAAGSGTLLTDSTATCVATLSSTGSPYTITATYTPASGSAYAGSNNSVVQVVLPAGTNPVQALAPNVTAVSPATGIQAGGTSVTITGSNFVGATAVDFGSTAATSFKETSDTSITAVAPAGVAGSTVDIAVTSPVGTSVASTASQYTYEAPPAVAAVSPSSGPAAGGTPVTISGTGFTGATAVDFGSVAAGDVTIVSPTEITATSPAGSSTVNVTVTTPAGTSSPTEAGQFTYLTATKPTLSVTGRTGRGDVALRGTAPAGSTVTVAELAFGQTSPRIVGTATATAAGTYAYTAYIRRTATFVVSADGVISSAATAPVSDKVGLTLRSSKVGLVSARITTNPTVTGVEATFYRINVGGTRTRIQTVEITASSGALTYNFGTTYKRITLVATVSKGDGALAGTSPRHSVNVKQVVAKK